MILVDTSVIADIFTKRPGLVQNGPVGKIEQWADQGPVCYDTIIFAELAVKFDTQKELEHRLSCFHLFTASAKRGISRPEKLLRSIGAQAARGRARCLIFLLVRMHTLRICPCSLVIPRRVRTFFPSVRLITP